MDKQDKLLRCRDMVERVLLTRKGEVITEELARERANNVAQALLGILLDEQSTNGTGEQT